MALKVNEIFGPTIQGEGPTAGRDVTFLRLSSCNLHCVWCDTPYTWNWKGTSFSHPEKYDKEKEVHSMSYENVILTIRGKGGDIHKSLVVSGGEPLLQQKDLLPVVSRLKDVDGYWIEVETNGTIVPDDELAKRFNMINCSSKLSNSGDPQKLREKPEALEKLVSLEQVIFKFVVSGRKDIPEILDLSRRYRIPSRRIYLMPLGKSQRELKENRTATQELCNEHGFHFTDRQHIEKFGAQRGV